LLPKTLEKGSSELKKQGEVNKVLRETILLQKQGIVEGGPDWPLIRFTVRGGGLMTKRDGGESLKETGKDEQSLTGRY